MVQTIFTVNGLEYVSVFAAASSSRLFTGHKAGQAVKKDLTREECVWLEPETKQWWQVDLGQDSPVHTVVLDILVSLVFESDCN